MSTIGSGISGVLQGQTSSKGKSVQGKAADTSEKGAFASAVASLQGKAGDGESGRKGGRIAIAETSRSQIQIEQATDTRTSGQRDIAALAEALQEASATASAKTETTPLEEQFTPQTDENGLQLRKIRAGEHETGGIVAKKDGEPKSKHAAGDELQAVHVDTKDVKEVKGTKDAKSVEEAPADTDVGNLLEMLSTPAVIPQSFVNGAAVQVAASGLMQDVKGQTSEKGSAKAELALAAKADGKPASNADAALLADAADTGEVPQSDTDQLFRLIRADGKGRDLDMSISGIGERTSVRDAAQTTAGKVETVTVLDSRRYIGLAPTSNAGAVTTAIAQDPNWAASLGSTGGLSHSEAAATGKVVNTLKIQMKPIDLGTVTATLRLHGDALVVSLQVETGEAYRQLSDDQDAIVKALRGHGFAVDQVSVQLSSIDRSSSAQQGDGQASQQQQQFSSQPQTREGGNGRQGGNGDGTRTFAGEGTSHDGNTSENTSSLSGGQPVRSGGVYL
ncbi:flagellar hook-length control protein FliK [Shinella sp. WSJ-2]|uniref:flagellar hook-length control protein FliK n=1 Tax=Shinella sp. WSJ-2 TaxID=2303749 RepID=UPI000E3E7664|nr:flagellar hook-length control protein FliK [Shinella sp. WSJ-2]RFZ88933.1 flagellar hook-length control protein FliK [Shinella sp. WSJ-2]